MSAKKYIDRDAALFELKTGFFPQSMEFTEAVSIAKGIIERAPGVDAVEVVRCKDCKWYCRDECRNPDIPIDDGASLTTDPDWFCAGGIRRETDEQR